MENKTSKNIMNGIGLITALIILILVSALIIGSLTSQSVFTNIVIPNSVTNETGGFINNSGYTLAQAGTTGFSLITISALNQSGLTISPNNYTVVAGVVRNATAMTFDVVNFTYSYTYTNNTNLAGVDIPGLGTAFGAFVTALIGFFSIVGVILAIVWLVGYIRPLFSKKDGIQSFGAN